ncbi:MAG TPA: branched-chain amino acid ABC transporter substrate-binding protein, partial [bacterium]|nr:branched-chain amino acid ABC transporter substrate-binding protein [bacterium]
MRPKKIPLSRRAWGLALSMSLIFALAALGAVPRTQAAAQVLYVGVNLPLTGADAQSAELIKNGVVLATEEANAKGGVAGYKIELIILDDATATAGQYDPAQAATNAKKLVANVGVVAAVGPEMSGSGKAMSPILSEGDLAIIPPSSTNPDITNPKFASQYRPKGKAVYFRTCTTDAFQGPAMANYFAGKLKVRTVYVVDDAGTFGVGIADAFQKRAGEKGIKVLGRDQLNPKEADYTTVLTKIKGLNPDALYYGGVSQAATKLVKQAYDVVPKMIKAGADGMIDGDILEGAGFPAAEGWYASTASPHITEDPEAQPVVTRNTKRFGKQPSDYAITAYDAAVVIFDAIERVVQSKKPVNRHTVRDAIQATRLKTVQGTIQFDENGDLVNKAVSIFQIKHDTLFPTNDVLHQFKF